MSMEHILTVRYELWDGNANQHFLLPIPQIAIMDVVQASFSEGEWTISNYEDGTSFHGRGEYKQEAILDYLKARLGLFDHGKEGTKE